MLQFVARRYAPQSIDHIHDVLSAILRTAMKWGHLRENPARGVDLPKLPCVRPKWALTTSQAAILLGGLAALPRTMVGLALLSGLRRGELFALRWRDIDEQSRLLTVREAVYDGVFATPKTEAGARQIPLSDTAVTLMAEWKAYVGNVEPDTLGVLDEGGHSDPAEQRVAPLHLPSVHTSGTSSSDLVDVPAHVLIVVAR
jgi:integrase